MSNHRTARERRSARTLAAAATAVGISGGLVLGHATNTTLANIDVDLAAVIGVGGASNPNSDRIPVKLSRDFTTNVAAVYGDFVGIDYPADWNFQNSVNVGVPRLTIAITNDQATNGELKTRVVSYSEGSLVAEQVKRNLAAGNPTNPPYVNDLDFVFIASPYVPNGGLFGRFPGFVIPGLVPQFSAATPTAYDSTYVYNEYDGISDFPAYFNPLAIANAVLGIAFNHGDQYYDNVDLDTMVEGRDYFKEEVDNSAGGTDTYIMIYNPHLPLLAPFRQLADAVGVRDEVEPIFTAIEPLLRVAIDAGYTDRTNANPGTPTPFSLITPPAKIIEALVKTPGAIAEGIDNATGQTQNVTTSSVPQGERKVEEAPVQQPALTVVDEVKGDAKDTPKETPKDAPKDEVEEKPKPRNVLRDVAKAVDKILHPTKVKDGNLVRPTTKAGEHAGGSNQNGDPAPSSTTPADQQQGTPDPQKPDDAADAA